MHLNLLTFTVHVLYSDMEKRSSRPLNISHIRIHERALLINCWDAKTLSKLIPVKAPVLQQIHCLQQNISKQLLLNSYICISVVSIGASFIQHL